jgi:glutamate/aspartate transport system substrate-binding protein
MSILRTAAIRGLIALSVAAALAAPAGAQELTGTLKKIKDSGTIVLGHRDASIPFSYFDDKQAAIGYALDLCGKIVEAVKFELKMPNLQVKLNPVTSATRIPLMANGTIDLECGSTTNNLERQKQVAFTITHFVTATRFVSKKGSNVKTLQDLKGKQIVSTSGTTNLKLITELNAQQNLGMNILAAKDHAEAFLMVDTGRAVAFFMDDILLYSLVATSKAPSEWAISDEPLSIEPYGIMLRRDDPAFKKVVDSAMIATYRSGEIHKIYEKWFLKPIPPKDVNLNVPMSAPFKKLTTSPTDSGDPNSYK